MSSPWGNAFSGAVPMNQIDALPLVTVQQFLSPDGADTIVYAGRVLKYWDAAAVGIVNAKFSKDVATGSGEIYQITSNWLDVTPCQFFVFTLTRDVLGPFPMAAQRPFVLQMQYKTDPADNPPTSLLATPGGPLSLVYAGWWNLVSNSITWPSTTMVQTQRFTLVCSPNNWGRNSADNVSLIIGPSVRFMLDMSANPPVETDTTISMSIWASS